ncbi:hypothetical protein BC833DRAFT_652651 [Globomyces pollinis-pini]|nr:hypothetical protein BC833DRAFT_652651 [Globomyces pollinis-pini]
MIRPLLLPLLISGQLVFQSTWKYTECEGPPITMQIFNETNPTQIYTDINELIVLPICGANPISIDTGCCIESLNLAFSYSYFAFTFQYMDDINDEQYPKGALNSLYCHLEYEVEGLYPNYILASSQCTEQFTCSLDGKLTIYADENCQEQIESYELNSATQTIQSTTIGTFNGNMFRVGQTDELFAIQWTAYHPGTILQPNFKSPMEVIALICIITSTFGTMYFMYQYGSSYQLNRRWNSLSNLIIQWCWFCSGILYTCYWCIAYEFAFQYLIVYEVYGICGNIATFLTAHDTVLTLLHFFHFTSSWSNKIATMLLLGIHIGLAGPNYILYFTGAPEVDENVRNWTYMVPIWHYLLHILNTFPPLYMLVMYSKILSQKTKLTIPKSLYAILSRNIKLTLAIIAQLVNFTLYCILTYVSTYTQILGNDRNLIANNLIILFCQVTHSLINGILMEQLREVCKTFHTTVQTSRKG